MFRYFNIYKIYMVRPGLKRLQVARQVKVQPNKTGTTNNTNRAIIFRKKSSSAKNIVFAELGNAHNKWTPSSKTFTPSYTEEEKKNDILCNCVMSNGKR